MIYHQPHNSKGNYNYNFVSYNDIVYQPHFHRNLEFILCLKGEVFVSVSGKSTVLLPGQAALVLSNQIHSFEVSGESKIWVAVFGEDYVPKFCSMIKGKQGETSFFTLSEPILDMVKKCLIDTEGGLLLRKGCFYAICDEYLKRIPLVQVKKDNDFIVGQMLDTIALHYNENISLKTLAEEFGYEYHYLSRLLNKGYGINFNQLLNSYRVEAATELLQTTKLTITEIAEKSGFQSIRNFNLVFKQITGQTPAEIRK